VDKLAEQLQESEQAIRQRRDEASTLRQEAEGLRADEIGARANVQTESKSMEVGRTLCFLAFGFWSSCSMWRCRARGVCVLKESSSA
jgi:hypothetical protein